MRIGILLEKFVYKFFPVIRVINFGRRDGMVEAVYWRGKDDVSFFLLKKMKHKDEFLPKSRVFDEKLYNGCPFIKLKFYSSESVGRFIDNLSKLKEEMALREIQEVIENGGELVWNKDGKREINFPNGSKSVWFTGKYVIKNKSDESDDSQKENPL